MNRIYLLVMIGIIVLVAAAVYGIIALKAREIRRGREIQRRLDEKNAKAGITAKTRISDPRPDTEARSLKDPR